MNSRVLAIVLALAAVAAGAGFLLLSERPEPRPATDAAAPLPESPEPVPPREPTPVEEPATAARRPAPTPAEAPAEAAPAAAPVDAPPVTATLRIESDVAGAEVFLDRTFLGQTPLTVPNVTPGAHRLNVTAAGYEGFSETIDVAPGPRDITVEFKAIRLNASVKVIHKHGVGSCSGTLVATPEGIRYETTNKGDAFTVALNGLDTFSVDYLEKNLRLKVKNGKTYNFTDPEGNADRLFVFHRDVEKVRTRLSQGS